MSNFATTPDAVRWISTVFNNITLDSVNQKLFGTAAVRDALVSISGFATTPESVRWLSDAICKITFSHSVNASLFGTTAVRDALVGMQSAATQPESVRWLANAFSNITFNDDTMLNLMKLLRDPSLATPAFAPPFVRHGDEIANLAEAHFVSL